MASKKIRKYRKVLKEEKGRKKQEPNGRIEEDFTRWKRKGK